MKDERYWPVLGTWLKDTAEAPPDPRQTARKVAERLPQTPQVRRCWWLPSLQRTPTPPLGQGQTTDGQPGTTTATTDRYPTTGRTRLMFSPVKAIIAGSLVFAIGGLMVIAQPSQRESSVLQAPAQSDGDGIAATHVTGTMTGLEKNMVDGTYTVADDFSHNTGYGFYAERFMEWSDPRLPMLMRVIGNWDFYGLEENDEVGGAISLAQNVRLEGPDGAWTGTVYGLLEETIQPEAYPQTTLMILEGEDDYEGLSAMFRAVYDEPPTDEIPDWEGYIFEGPLTPVPEMPAD